VDWRDGGGPSANIDQRIPGLEIALL